MSKLTLVRRGFEGIKISGDKDLKSTGTPFPPCVSHNALSKKQLLCSSFRGSKLEGRGCPYIGRGAPSRLHIYLEPKGLRAVWTYQRNYAADHYKQM